MTTKITTEIKAFITNRFGSKSDIDDLCRELEIANVYEGNYKDQVTDIINDIETNYPGPVGKLYHATKKLKDQFHKEIDDLFQVEGLSETRDSVAVLFSDIKGFSKITNEVLKVEIEKVNHKLRKMFEDHSDFIYMNTWGDAFYVVFKTCTGLLQQTIELRDYFINTDWKEKGFEDQLEIRIGLHHGEAVVMRDGKSVSNVIGKEIDTTARIEPVAIPNVIFCSKIFRDMVSVKTKHVYSPLEKIKLVKERDIAKGKTKPVFYPLGKVKLAKDYGPLELYSIDEEVTISDALKP